MIAKLRSFSGWTWRNAIRRCPNKRGCFIGIGSKINQNIIVGENSIIGSGSVVVKNVKKNSIYAGVPAKQIGVLEWKKSQYLQQQEVIFLF